MFRRAPSKIAAREAGLLEREAVRSGDPGDYEKAGKGFRNAYVLANTEIQHPSIEPTPEMLSELIGYANSAARNYESFARAQTPQGSLRSIVLTLHAKRRGYTIAAQMTGIVASMTHDRDSAQRMRARTESLRGNARVARNELRDLIGKARRPA